MRFCSKKFFSVVVCNDNFDIYSESNLLDLNASIYDSDKKGLHGPRKVLRKGHINEQQVEYMYMNNLSRNFFGTTLLMFSFKLSGNFTIIPVCVVTILVHI